MGPQCISRQTDRRGEVGPRKRLRQSRDPDRPADARPPAHDAGRHLVHPRHLAGGAGQHDAATRHFGDAEFDQPLAHQAEGLLDPGPDHADQHPAADLAPVRRLLLADPGRIEQVAVVGAGGDHAAIERLDPLRYRRAHQEPGGDVAGHVVAAVADLLDTDQLIAQENRERGRAAAHVDAHRPGSLLVLDQRRQPARIGGGDNPGEIEIALADAFHQVRQRPRVDRQHMHCHRQLVPGHAARIGDPGLVVDRDLDRLCVKDLPRFADRRRRAGSHDIRYVAFGDLTGLRLDLGRGREALRIAAGEGDDDLIDPAHLGRRHLLGVQQRHSDRPTDLVHVDDFAATHTARLHIARAHHLDGAEQAGAEVVVSPGLGQPRRVELEDQAGNLRRSDIENRQPAPLDRQMKARTHVPVRRELGKIHVSSPPNAATALLIW